MSSIDRRLLLGASALFLNNALAVAADIDLELEVGVGWTDNITRAEDTTLSPATDDTVFEAGLAVAVTHESARVDADLRGSVFWHDFQDGPYDSETLPAFDGTARFRIVEETLSWFVVGNMGQQSVNPFQPVTPDNREDVSFLTTGPSLFAPIGTRFYIRADAWYSDVNYEIQPLDNARQGGQFSLARQINPTRELSLNIRAERTEFDLSVQQPSIDKHDAFLQFSTEGSRNELTLGLGVSGAERDGIETEGPLVNIDWRRQVSGATSFLLQIGSRVSDSAESFRGSQQGSFDVTTTQIQQVVSDPFQENYAGLSVTHTTGRTNISVGGRWSEEEFEQSILQSDRRVNRVNARVTRQLGSAWTIGLSGNWSRREYPRLSQEDEDTRLGVNLVWERLRTIEIEVRFDRFARDSTDVSAEFTENRVYAGFRYVPDIS